MTMFIRARSGNLIFDGAVEIALHTIKEEGRKAKLLIFMECLNVLNAVGEAFRTFVSFSWKAKEAELLRCVALEQQFCEWVRGQGAGIQTNFNNKGNLSAHITEKSRDVSGSWVGFRLSLFQQGCAVLFRPVSQGTGSYCRPPRSSPH